MSKYTKHLTRELDNVYPEEQQEGIAFYVDQETDTHYIWKFDLNGSRHQWSLNKITKEIMKVGR